MTAYDAFLKAAATYAEHPVRWHWTDLEKAARALHDEHVREMERRAGRKEGSMGRSDISKSAFAPISRRMMPERGERVPLPPVLGTWATLPDAALNIIDRAALAEMGKADGEELA
jgi:hypothetical protein